MEAEVRTATRAEWGGVFRPDVCAVRGQPVFFYRRIRGILTDKNRKVLFQRPFSGMGLHRFPDGTSLTVDSQLTFDGCPVSERWPTPKQRILVVGTRVIRVRPEDDALLFDFEGPVPPMDMTMMAFLIRFGDGNSG